MVNRLAWARLLLPMLILAAYAGVAAAGFVWDDRALLGMNSTLDHPTFNVVFGADLWKGTGEAFTPYYRPMMTISLLVDRWVLGGSAAAAHLQSLAWHLLVVELVFRLFSPRIGDTRALVVAAIVGLHPVQSEAVAWIAARNDLMAAAGVVGALVALDARRFGIAAAAGLFAMLSKESAVLLPLIYGAWRFAWGERLRLPELVTIGVAIGLALAMRVAATLGELEAIQRVHPYHDWGPLYVLVDWLGWLTSPWPLTGTATVYWAPKPTQWIGALVTLVALGTALRRAPRVASGLLGLAALSGAPALFPTLTTYIVGERYLYLPLVGVAGAVVAAAPRVPWLLGIPPLVGALVALHVRLPDWASDMTLFEAAVQRHPDGYTWHMYGDELARNDRLREGYLAAEKSVGFAPHYPFSCPELGNLGTTVLAMDTLLERLPEWDEWGCRRAAGFDDAVLWRFADEGRWDLITPRVRTMTNRDTTLRSVAVRGAWMLRDGDLDGLMLSATRHPDGAADYLDRALGVANARRP